MEKWRVVGSALRSVKLGMPRAEVEGLMGRPEPGSVGPAERSGDQTVYRIRYATYLAEGVWFAPEVRGFCETVLEYDAARPGHPLLRATCTPLPLPLPIGGKPIPVVTT
jgi:hypothetical protein